MLADALPIDPHDCRVVHGVEAQQISSARIRMSLGLEFFPVPDHSVIRGKSFLNDRGNAGSLGILPRFTEPILFAANVAGIGSDRPLPIERERHGGSFCPGLARLLARNFLVYIGQGLKRFGSQQWNCDAQARSKASGKLQKATTLHMCSLFWPQLQM